jgi:hypothetical protein
MQGPRKWMFGEQGLSLIMWKFSMNPLNPQNIQVQNPLKQKKMLWIIHHPHRLGGKKILFGF